MKIEETNHPKEDDSKYLKRRLEEIFENIVGYPLYVEISYFSCGRDAFNWKTAKLLWENGIREMTNIPMESNELFQMMEWVCRWADGTVNILIVEDNLKRFARGDKEAIDGLCLHILGHIADMDRRDHFTSFQEWAGLVDTEEESKIFSRARDIALEYSAEKVALERGDFSSLLKAREKTSANYEWLKSELKVYKKGLQKVRKVEIPTRKEYVLGTSLVFLAYQMAWKKSGHREAFSKVLNTAKKKLHKIYLEMEIAEKIAPVEAQAEKYILELEDIFNEIDLADVTAVREVLRKYISKM